MDFSSSDIHARSGLIWLGQYRFPSALPVALEYILSAWVAYPFWILKV
nr:MAG TPA: hypothetical protein [Caudoviricetes sp.]